MEHYFVNLYFIYLSSCNTHLKCPLTPDEDWMSVEINWEVNENFAVSFRLLFRYLDNWCNGNNSFQPTLSHLVCFLLHTMDIQGWKKAPFLQKLLDVHKQLTILKPFGVCLHVLTSGMMTVNTIFAANNNEQKDLTILC